MARLASVVFPGRCILLPSVETVGSRRSSATMITRPIWSHLTGKDDCLIQISPLLEIAGDGLVEFEKGCGAMRKDRNANTSQWWFCKHCNKLTIHETVRTTISDWAKSILGIEGRQLWHDRRCQECGSRGERYQELTATIEITVKDAWNIHFKMGSNYRLEKDNQKLRQQQEKLEKEINDLRACLDRVRIQCVEALGETNETQNVVATEDLSVHIDSDELPTPCGMVAGQLISVKIENSSTN